MAAPAYNKAYDFGQGVDTASANSNLPSGGTFSNGYYYFYMPSADGGYNFYKAANNGGNTDVQAIAQSDYSKEGGQMMPWDNAGTDTSSASTSGSSAPTADQLAAVLQTHNANVKNINAAYGAGLLSYEQQQKALNQNRQDIMGSMNTQQNANQAYFSNVSPDAYKSQIGNYNQKILDAYNTSNNNLTDQQTTLDQAKAGFNNTEQNAMANENANYNAQYSPYTSQVNDSLTPMYSGGASTVAPTLTPITMANVGASLSPYSPNGTTGQQASTTSKAAANPLDQYLNPNS